MSERRTGKTETCPGCGQTLYEMENENGEKSHPEDAEGYIHDGPGGCANSVAATRNRSIGCRIIVDHHVSDEVCGKPPEFFPLLARDPHGDDQAGRDREMVVVPMCADHWREHQEHKFHFFLLPGKEA